MVDRVEESLEGVQAREHQGLDLVSLEVRKEAPVVDRIGHAGLEALRASNGVLVALVPNEARKVSREAVEIEPTREANVAPSMLALQHVEVG